MGRKIPARKHHGVRDPIKQAELHYQRIKDNINNPPGVQSNQKISYKLSEFARLKQAAKSGKLKKQAHIHHREDRPRNRVEKRLAPIVPQDNETKSQFLRRVNRITSEGLKEAEYEAKYGVDVVRDERTGRISINKRPKDELTELMQAKRKTRDKKEKNKKTAIDPQTAKSLIKQAIEETKVEEMQEKAELEEYKYDIVKFGEVVQAPPTLITPRRAQKNETVPRPGKKGNLLLQQMLGNKNIGEEMLDKKVAKQKEPGRDFKGKRRDLPPVTRQMLETEQSQAIEMYREMKRSRMNK